MNHMKEYWLEEMNEIKKIVSPGDAKVLTKHVFDMLELRNMSLVDLAAVLITGEIILGTDYFDQCIEAGVKSKPGIYRLVMGKNTHDEDVIVVIALDYKGNVPVVQSIITIYSLEEEIEFNDPRRNRKEQIRKFLYQRKEAI